MAARDAAAARGRLHRRPDDRGHLLAVSFLAGSYVPEDESDYRYLYELLSERVTREEDRGKGIDAKATAMLAGIVAFIGFSFRLQYTAFSTAAALLYCVPLSFLLSVFLAERPAIAPSPESLVTFFPQYPTETLRKAIAAVERSCRAGIRVNATKARRLDIATILMALTTVVVLVVQFFTSVR
jgi:hypothetical protein